jgi:hypothetical protein
MGLNTSSIAPTNLQMEMKKHQNGTLKHQRI